MNVYDRISQLNIVIPEPTQPSGLYRSIRFFSNNLVYTSGIGPNSKNGYIFKGKVGCDLTLGQAQEAAKSAVLNLLSVLEAGIKDLNNIKSIVKMLTFVACSDDYYDHTRVADSAVQILIDIFGEEIGIPARSAIGTNSLPGNIPVEIEAIFELWNMEG